METVYNVIPSLMLKLYFFYNTIIPAQTKFSLNGIFFFMWLAIPSKQVYLSITLKNLKGEP